MAAPRKLTIAGGAMAALLALAAPAIQKYEGLSLVPYRDQVGKLTVCYGETNVKMRRYTLEECKDMFNGQAEAYSRAVAERNPSLVGHPYQWAAATSLAYNIGVGNYNKSTVAKNFDAGKWTAACNSFKSWVYAGGRVNRGLQNRRADEIRLCLTQLPSDVGHRR